MKPARRTAPFPWIPVTAGALMVVAGFTALLRVPPPATQPPRLGSAAVGLTRLGGAVAEEDLRDEVALLDPTPLFLPTRWNTGRSAPAGDGERLPGTVFADFPPNLTFSQDDPNIRFPAAVAVPAGPVAALRPGQGGAATGTLARADVTVAALPRRLGYLKVMHADTGAVAWSGELVRPDGETPDQPPPPDLWSPLEMVAAVSPVGLVGVPALTASSGSEAWDDWVPRYLAGAQRLGARLPPGIYRIQFGP